jgi:hypothetical protein
MLPYGTTQAKAGRSQRMIAGTRVIETTESQRDSTFAAEVMNHGNPQELVDCIVTSERLFHILMAEAEALKTFQKERLLELITEKAALTWELAQRVKALESSPSFVKKNVQERSQPPGSTRDTEEKREGEHTKLGILRQLLSEITRCNQRNHVFVQGSLNHWEDLLNLCLPSTYVAGNDGQAVRQSIRAKGLALNREI